MSLPSVLSPLAPFSRLYKLLHHQRSQAKQFATEDVALNPKDFPFLSAGDVISVYNPEENHVPRLLLKVTRGSLREDFMQKDAISLEQSLASTFQLKPYTDVVVTKVDQSEVELDSLELTFRDQYLGRSEMWRLKMGLVDTGVYIGKKIEFCSATIRCNVQEMWCAGHRVGSGIVGASTKIVFRSSTSMVYVFLQMSSEMWEFDIYGDLYFEKAVNGFLVQLFTKWKKNGSNHEVTIVLFSRVYYDATSIESFPEHMRDCLRLDYKGKYYEDFYRVAVQNEKYEDWGSTLIFLRHTFVHYQKSLFEYHKRGNPRLRIPKGTIASAAQGNFLEVLNMSLNVFEKHFLDRSFDRTGQLSVVVTPGVGVFEVDRELANLTMQRIIDNGVGSDLVCIGEQPLHAVPLLKFHNKTNQQSNNDYSMPHWINLSFYSTHRKVGYASYIPRIRLPAKALTALNSDRLSIQEFSGSPILGHGSHLSNVINEDTTWSNSIYDYDDYDDKIFKIPGSHSTLKKRNLSKKSPVSDAENSKVFLRQNSEPEIMNQSTFSDPTSGGGSAFNTLANVISERSSLILPLPSSSCSSAITIPSQKVKKNENFYSNSFGALNIETRNRVSVNPKEKWFADDQTVNKSNHGRSPESSYGGSPKDGTHKITPVHNKPKDPRKPGRALINPFDPSHVVIKLTSNRRRWTHIFPRGPTGNLIQQHHFQGGTKLEIVHEGEMASTPSGTTENTEHSGNGRSKKSRPSVARQPSDVSDSKKLTLLWGATGEQEWTPALTTGVDWKSLTIPACLPLTTDYFPDERSLQVDYLVSDYSLLPDDVNADYSQQRAVYRRPLNTMEVFLELVSQRLAQGFQLVVRSQNERTTKIKSSTVMRGSVELEASEEYLLSIGRIFHRIRLQGSTITVTRYRPRHPYPSINVSYRYRFGSPSSCEFERASADFTTEKLENYNWNYLDHYICTRGDPDFGLNDSLKYWRFRMLILPIRQPQSKRPVEDLTEIGNNNSWKVEETSVIVQDFLKFIETCINRIRRPNNSFPKGTRGSSGGSQTSASSSGFRERVNSNKMADRDRPRLRSGSRGAADKGGGKTDAGSGRVSPLEGPSLDMKNLSILSDPFVDLQSPPPPTQLKQETDPEVKLKSNISRKEIVSAMRSLKTGFSLIKSSDLPPWTFVSYDAVLWLMSHMEGVISEVQAVEIFNEMLKEGLIIHASGDKRHPFMFGFYLYYIVIDESEGLESIRPHGDCSLFHNEWMEVEVPYKYCFDRIPPTVSDVTPADGPVSGSLEAGDLPNDRCKNVYVDVDVGKKSDRQEWGHVKYQCIFKPDEAFELSLQWMQSTGAIVADLVQGWSRKAQLCNLQLVPIPNDLFDNSDSLRGPTYINLNMKALEMSSPVTPERNWPATLLQFKQHIIKQLGFMRCYLDKQVYYVKQKVPKQSRLLYVHFSGNIFILIPQDEDMKESGFLWSNNYMVSKRWRTSATPVLGDEPYIQQVLKDFKEFCLNAEDKLADTWKSFILEQ